MLGTARYIGALALITTAVLAAACGSDDDNADNAGGSGPSSSSGATGGSPSTGGAGGGGGTLTCEDDEGTTLALTKLEFGAGQSGQWKKVGRNIDGLTSSGASTDVCIPFGVGDPFTAFPDGDGGIDNSFGKNIVPMILALRPEWPTEINNNLEDGDFNALLKMYCLPESGDVPGMVTKVFGGVELDFVPKYDGSDQWPVAPELLADPAVAESSTITFPSSTVVGQSYDSGAGQTFIFTLPMHYNGGDTTLKLTLHAAQVTMDFADGRKSATKGIISGVLDTEEFIDQVQKIGFLADMCDETNFDTIVTNIREASDILTDGTQDTRTICNGISIGVNFEMKEVQIGGVGPIAPIGEACP